MEPHLKKGNHSDEAVFNKYSLTFAIYLYLILFLFKFMLCARTCRTFIHGHNIKTCQWKSNNSKATDNRWLTIVCSTTIRVSYQNFFNTDDCGDIIFFFEGQSLIKLNIYNPYVGTCGRQQGGFFLCCWDDMHHRLINITQGEEELNRNKNVPWGGRGEKYRETWCILTTYRSQIFLVLKCSYVGRCFLNPRFETTSWSQHRQEPIPLQTYGMNQFRFWMQLKFISMTLSKTETNSKGSEH